MSGGSRTSETTDLLSWNFHTVQSPEFAENGVRIKKNTLLMRGQRRMAKLVQATNTQTTTLYNSGMQKGISECTMHWTLKWMGCNNRRPHWVPLLSATIRNTRLQWTQNHQTWTIKDWKNVIRFEELWFLLQHADGMVRIWHKQHESMDQSYLVSMVQADGGVMVWEMFSWHTLGLLIPIDHQLNVTTYLIIVADHVHPFMTTVYQFSNGYFQQNNAQCHKACIFSE